MAGGEPRLGTTATYMRHNDHGAGRLSTKIDRLHDRKEKKYRVFSAGSVKKWSKFGLAGPSASGPTHGAPLSEAERARRRERAARDAQRAAIREREGAAPVELRLCGRSSQSPLTVAPPAAQTAAPVRRHRAVPWRSLLSCLR